MSRKTKAKNRNYGILENGQVVRIDTILEDPDRYQAARRYRPGEVVWDELDLDHTRAHREELKED